MRYAINIFCGKQFVGNALCSTLGDCMHFLQDDGFADRAKITDMQEGTEFTIKVKFEKTKEVRK